MAASGRGAAAEQSGHSPGAIFIDAYNRSIPSCSWPIVLKMKQKPGIYYSDAQKALMWDRWQKGDSMHAIARLFNRGHASLFSFRQNDRLHVSVLLRHPYRACLDLSGSFWLNFGWSTGIRCFRGTTLSGKYQSTGL